MQGYLTLALGPPRYIEMAANLAASIKVMDPGRPVCLVHDAGAEVPWHLRRLFDHKIGLEADPLYPDVMNKIRLFHCSPYEQTMFVDADCLLVKRDIDIYWAKAQEKFFSITGGKRTSGEWKGLKISSIMKQEDVHYIIVMNSGVFYFDKSDHAASFFSELNRFYMLRRNFLGGALHRGVRHQVDEIYFGVFMGLKEMDCNNMNNNGINSWMVSTWRSIYCNVNPTYGTSSFYKPTGFIRNIPIFPTGFDKLSPTFAHFIGLKPRRLYMKLSKYFKEQALSKIP